MFTKQAQFAAAAIALTLATGAFAQSPAHNVFDSEAILAQPASASSQGVSRDAVQAEYIAQRAAVGISSFNPEAYRQAQLAGSGAGFVALFKHEATANTPVAHVDGKTRAEVRAEFLSARASGEVNQFDTESNIRLAPGVRQAAPTALAHR
jgi:hypothetical protein